MILWLTERKTFSHIKGDAKMALEKRFFYEKKRKAFQRIGPHQSDIISLLVGILLGESWGEKRVDASRFHLHVSSRNLEYLSWLQTQLAQNGYCSPGKPKLTRQIGKKGKQYFSYKIRTYSFSSLTWLYDLFYESCPETLQFRKRISPTLEKWLTPQALAVWLMNDGGASGAGIRVALHCFTKKDVELLQHILLSKWGLLTTLHKSGSRWVLCIPKHHCPFFLKIVDPFLHKSMRDKVNRILP